jgi:Right handed beta helix region
VTIDGFTVQGATNANVFGFGILLGAGTSGSQVLNNIIQNNIAGLSLSNNPAGNPALIQHNLFQNNNQPGPISGTAIYTDQFNAGGKVANVTIDSNSFLNNQNTAVLIGPTNATQGAANITISNNVMTGDGNAVLLFNTTNGVVTGNTITGSTGSQVVIGGGDNGVQITQNFIQNGATRGIRIGDFGGGSTNSNVTIHDNSISGNPTAGIEIDSAAGAYTGTLDATQNYFGSPSGPTTPNNPGGTGDKIIDPNNQATFSPFLTSGVDSQPNTPGFQPAANASNAIVVNGTAGNVTVIVTATGPDSGSYTVNGGPPIVFSNDTSFTFNGGPGDALIIHNPAGGLFAPSGGVIYNGGTGANSLQILDGFAAIQDFTFSPNSAGGGHNGAIAFVNGATTANYTYSNLTPVLVNAGTPNSVLFMLPNSGQDNKVVVQAAGFGMSQIISQDGAFETTTFVNPSTSLTIGVTGATPQTLTLTPLGAGIPIGGVGPGASTLNVTLDIAPGGTYNVQTAVGETVTVNGGSGSTVYNVQAAADSTVTIVATPLPSSQTTFNVQAAAGALVTINGGAAPNVLNFDAQGHSIGVGAGIIDLNGRPTVVYTFITTLNLNNAAGVESIAGPDTADRPTAFTGLDAQERFVQALYLDELGRAGVKAELDGWVSVLNGPGGSQTVVAGDILRSQEARDHLVKSWYFTFLGRQANGTEEMGFVNELLQGQKEEQVLSQILGSSEFDGRAQTLSSTGTSQERDIQALYQLLLNRTGGSVDVAGWVSQLPRIGLQGVAQMFLTSAEFRGDLFEGYYNALLHRPSDPAISNAVFSNLDAATIRINFEGSPEFFTNG